MVGDLLTGSSRGDLLTGSNGEGVTDSEAVVGGY